MKRICMQCKKDLRFDIKFTLCSSCRYQNKLKYKMNNYRKYKLDTEHYCQDLGCESRIDLDTGQMKSYNIKDMKLIKSNINDGEKILICLDCWNRRKK